MMKERTMAVSAVSCGKVCHIFMSSSRLRCAFWRIWKSFSACTFSTISPSSSTSISCSAATAGDSPASEPDSDSGELEEEEEESEDSESLDSESESAAAAWSPGGALASATSATSAATSAALAALSAPSSEEEAESCSPSAAASAAAAATCAVTGISSSDSSSDSSALCDPVAPFWTVDATVPASVEDPSGRASSGASSSLSAAGAEGKTSSGVLRFLLFAFPPASPVNAFLALFGIPQHCGCWAARPAGAGATGGGSASGAKMA
mmetsp:Transcript_131543/g.281203  ORF Transcript_131543/g.281203 Transcript_131543/m.281203 type:complete len:265 (-) Transcript_131543:2-796(-)